MSFQTKSSHPLNFFFFFFYTLPWQKSYVHGPSYLKGRVHLIFLSKFKVCTFNCIYIKLILARLLIYLNYKEAHIE